MSDQAATNLHSAERRNAIPDTIRGLIARPHESISVELKNWFDIDTPEGQAKIARACIALRNQNGGYLVIGFDNESLTQSKKGRPADVVANFHPDRIQAIVSKYASQAFEVSVHFPEREGFSHPVIQVPAGVTTPVACRADLRHEDAFLLRESEIYVRSLKLNGTVSTGRASCGDLEELMRRCQDNREADLASVLGRMVQGVNKEKLLHVFQSLAEVTHAVTALEIGPPKIIENGASRFETVVAERQLHLPPVGYWETGLTLNGQLSGQRANRNFLQLLAGANPDLTGWPVWLDSSAFTDSSTHPYVSQGNWEALIYDPPDDDWGWSHLDFWILKPIGHFYLRRALQDDMRKPDKAKPLETLEPRLMTLRVAEALAVGQSFAKALAADEATLTLSFGFRWTRLRGRRLVPWGDPSAFDIRADAAHDDQASSAAELPITANEETIARTTHEALRPLLAVFGGYDPPYGWTKNLVERLLRRRL